MSTPNAAVEVQSETRQFLNAVFGNAESGFLNVFTLSFSESRWVSVGELDKAAARCRR